MRKQFIIWGSKGHAKVLADVVTLVGGRVCAFFDNDPSAVPSIEGVPIYYGPSGFKRWRETNGDLSSYSGLVAIGGHRGRDRLQVLEYFKAHTINTVSLIHPAATVAPSSKISLGSQVLAGAMISSGSEIGKGCIINNRSGVDHECRIEDGCHIAPGATLCGQVQLAQNVMVGAGAIVLPRLHVGRDTVIGAGSVVTKDLPENVVVCGNPARIIRSNKAL